MIEIVYQDEFIVAINKPSGLLVHRSLIDKHETRFAVQLIRDQIGQKVYPVHRLDKPTSGILVFALNSEIARLLTAQFTEGHIQKQYIAVVRGHCEEEGIIDYALKEQLDKLADALAEPDKPAQEALTYYQCLNRIELPIAVGRYSSARYSLLALQPKTGRKHQLRRHMKHISHPIIGDTTHGDGRQNTLFRTHYGCQRLLLHATHLRLTHPKHDKTLTLYAPLTADFEVLLEQCGLAAPNHYITMLNASDSCSRLTEVFP